MMMMMKFMCTNQFDDDDDDVIEKGQFDDGLVSIHINLFILGSKRFSY